MLNSITVPGGARSNSLALAAKSVGGFEKMSPQSRGMAKSTVIARSIRAVTFSQRRGDPASTNSAPHHAIIGKRK